MEPRPQSTRAAQSQPTSRQPAAGAGRPPEETAHYQQPDPTMLVAPPRTDYDYSPLDLAPPGQRRRRQLVAAALGGLLMLVLVAAIVFAFLVLRDPGGDDGDADLAAIATRSIEATQTAIAQQASTPDATEPASDETQAAGETGQPTATASLDTAGEHAAVEPTRPAANAGGAGPTSEELTAMLPGQDIMPVGLDSVSDSTLTLEDVVGALGGSREAETNLTNWGWSGNAQRSFTASDPAALSPDATTDLTVSLHGFSNDQAAAEALTFYSDVLVNSGYQEVEVGDIGATNRMLLMPQEDGGTTVALYIQQGPVLYRIGGYSPGGDPTTNVVNVATAVISQQAAAGQ
jgi:hypothetical protein